MGPHAEALGLDEERPRASAGLIDGWPHGLVDGDGVKPIDDSALDAVGRGAVGDVGDGHLLLGALGDGVAVVLDEEDDGQLVDGGEVERLVEVATAGAALATAGEGDDRVVAHLRRERDPDSVHKLGGDDAGLGEHAALRAAPVRGHLPSEGVGVVALPKDVEHGLARGHAEHEHDAEIAVVGSGVVNASLERHARANLRGFLSGPGNDEVGSTLAVEGHHALFKPAREEHVAVHGLELLLAEEVVVQHLAGPGNAGLAGGHAA